MRTPDTLTKPIAPVGPLADTARSLRHVMQAILGCLAMGLAAAILLRNTRALEIAIILGFGMAGVDLVGRVVLDWAIEAAEVLTRRDINQDGAIGDGGRPLVVNKKPVEWKSEGELWAAFVTQSVAHPDERALLRMGFTDTQIGIGRDMLIARGLAAWKSTDRRHGWEIAEGMDADDVLTALPYCDLNDETVQS